MRLALQAVGAAALGLVVAAPSLYLAGAIGAGSMQWSVLIATLLWFAVAPLAAGPTAEVPRAAESGGDAGPA